MSASLNQLLPDLQPYARDLVQLAGEAGLLPRVTSTLRSRAEQTRLYREFQRGGRRYPAAPPGTSAHEFGAAFDLVVSPHEAIYDVADVWHSWGGLWSPKDDVHFELPGWQSLIEAPPPTAPTAEERSVVDRMFAQLPYGEFALWMEKHFSHWPGLF